MDIVFLLLFCGLFTEAITELLFNGEIFDKLRNKLSEIGFFKRLFQCKYCLSVWCGFISAVLFLYLFDFFIVKLFCLGIIFHRISNYIHGVYKLLDIERD